MSPVFRIGSTNQEVRVVYMADAVDVPIQLVKLGLERRR
jgi:hypothetical protein